MELSDPAIHDPNSSSPNATDRRRSARTRSKPTPQVEVDASRSSNGSTKRKRADLEGDPSVDGDEGLSEEESNLEESDGAPDEEELKEKRKKVLKTRKSATKPIAKSQKKDSRAIIELPVRPATNGVKGVSKPKKPRPVRANLAASDEGSGLYGMFDHFCLGCVVTHEISAEVFSQGHTPDAVAADWMTRYEQHQAAAMCDLINFVLKCTGCDLQVDLHDIEDPDNAASRLTDLQDEYHSLKITDYPLISRTKGSASFRSTLISFFDALISTAHAAGVLYSDEALIENIQVWVTSMSSSAIRPFRHTATVVSLSICTTMCARASEISDNVAKTMRQKISEEKKKSVNKARIAALEAKIKEAERNRAGAERIILDVFDTVFVNRYRDVDPKIRVECVAALGTWILKLPEVFFTAAYIKYLGWVLSDTVATTRAEVIKQLSKLYKTKDNVGRLRAFTERFRPRLVEMATRDAEPSIRATTVELLDMVRENGLLEPGDVDVVGRLIFDSEPRVRKAVAPFFAENINDSFESTTEEVGGMESIEEVLGEEVEDDYNTPRATWLKYACLAEVLQLYDDGGEEMQDSIQEYLNISRTDSRFSLAAQAIYDSIPEVKDWESLAGYLLYDLSDLDSSNSDSKRAFLKRCQLNEQQEVLLLQILCVSVKARLVEAVASETDKKGKRTKARVEESREIQETIAIRLTQVIPHLLKKYGSNPATASAVLRLEHIMNLGIFQELRQDSTAYSALLDHINKQFLSHIDVSVLMEASTALLHARSYEDLEEITDDKMHYLWEQTMESLRTLSRSPSDSHDKRISLRNTIRRIANLASISNCVDVFNTEILRLPDLPSQQPSPPPYDILLKLIEEHPSIADLDKAELEEINELLTNALKALIFYHMWQVRSVQVVLADNDSTTANVPEIRPLTEFAKALISLMDKFPGPNPVSFAAGSTYLDLYTLFATFRHITPPARLQETIKPDKMVQQIPHNGETLILRVYRAAEKQHAQKSHRALEPVSDEELDLNLSDSDSDEESDDEAGDARHERTTTTKLFVEKQLCEITGKIVLAVLAKVFTETGEAQVRKALERNRMRLGPNFKAVVDYFDGSKTIKEKGKKAGSAAPGSKSDKQMQKGKVKSREVVEDGDEEAEEEEGEEGEEEDEEEEDNAGNGEHGPESERDAADEETRRHEPSRDSGIENPPPGKSSPANSDRTTTTAPREHKERSNPADDDDGDEIMGD